MCPAADAGIAPRVSVVIPAYNVSQYVGDAVASAVAQTAPPHEIIVVNDGSTDTPALELTLAPYRSRIKYLQQTNLGVSAARNAAIAASEGDLLAFLDADDRWHREFLESQVSFLLRGGFDMVYADAMLVGNHSEAGKSYMESVRSRGEPTLTNLLTSKCHPITSGTVVRRESVVAAGLFSPSLRRAEDFELWVRLAHAGARIGHQTRILLEYQIRAGSLSGDVARKVESQLEALTQIHQTIPLAPAAAAIVEHQIRRSRGQLELERGKAFLAKGDYESARAQFQAAVAWIPSAKLWLVRLALRVAPNQLRWIFGHLRPNPWN